jgi:alanine racemase
MAGLADIAGPALHINLDNLAANWRSLQDMSGTAACSGVVKADAYGLGVAPVSLTLWAAGCRTFFVASPIEAVTLRDLLPDSVIYVLNGAYGDVDRYVIHQLRPVVSSRGMLDYWQAATRDKSNVPPIALHIDTGMNRLGLTGAAWQRLGGEKILSGLDISLVMSHLACADEKNHPLTVRQLNEFSQLTDNSYPRSLANSGGIVSGEKFQFDLTRPGIAVYGGAIGDVHNALLPVVRATSSILQIRTVRAGETISYGGTYQVECDTKVAIVELGYADGYLRSGASTTSTAGGSVAISGRRAPVLGRVTMDLTMVDVSDIPAAAPGDQVEVIGPDVSIDQAARAAGTVSYEFLTRLGGRYRRSYLGGSET